VYRSFLPLSFFISSIAVYTLGVQSKEQQVFPPRKMMMYSTTYCRNSRKGKISISRSNQSYAQHKPRGQSPSRERTVRAARGEARAHLLPRPGRTRLPRPLGYAQLPRPVRVHSWGGWVRNGIKVHNLYHRLPRLLGYT